MSGRIKYIEEIDGLYKPLGAYSFASIDTFTKEVKTAGQIGNDESGALVEGGIGAQTHQVMSNLQKIIGAAATEFSNVTRSYVCLRSEDDFADFNAVYSSYFEGQIPPPRAAIEGSPPVPGALVEIFMDAALPFDPTPTR